ncbi:Mobile element protein [Caballeronia sordidicola]|uniref:Mobile element protein n=1 Tax=Caballeronia sordidicola TaxID=196367 RepID=A0A242MC01_CABSO|nr:Mobile element protein [Caballeronia sordidicola]
MLGWIKQEEVDSGERKGATTSERERFKALERENKQLRRANEILKLARARSTGRCNTFWSNMRAICLRANEPDADCYLHHLNHFADPACLVLPGSKAASPGTRPYRRDRRIACLGSDRSVRVRQRLLRIVGRLPYTAGV